MTPTEQQIRTIIDTWLVLRDAQRALVPVVAGRAPTLDEQNRAASVADQIDALVRRKAT